METYAVVAIKDMSAGNESVGEMWKETKVFSSQATLESVMDWVGGRKNVVLSIPENAKEIMTGAKTNV